MRYGIGRMMRMQAGLPGGPGGRFCWRRFVPFGKGLRGTLASLATSFVLTDLMNPKGYLRTTWNRIAANRKEARVISYETKGVRKK